MFYTGTGVRIWDYGHSSLAVVDIWTDGLMVNLTSGAMDVDGAPEGESIKQGKRKFVKHSKGKRRAAAVFPGLKGSGRGKINKKRK